MRWHYDVKPGSITAWPAEPTVASIAEINAPEAFR